MKERIIDIPTADGPMETFVTHPEEGGPFPAVILYMDVWGVREELYEIARRVGSVGYYCMVPDFYHRQGKVRFAYYNDRNEMISLSKLDEGKRQAVLTAGENLSDAMVVDDTGAILEFFDAGEPVRPGPVGSVGYCMGGRHVLCAAAAYPDRFQASASLHGTTLISDKPDSPHLSVEKFRGELYCGFAETDPYAPMSLVEELDKLLQPCAVAYRYEIHKGAVHGYALPDRDIRDRRATARDWELIFAMFRRQMPLATT